MQSKMNLSAFLLLTIIASVQASFWPGEWGEELAAKMAAAKASRKLTTANAVWHEMLEETVSEKPDNSARMLKGKKDKKKKPKKPKVPKECTVVSAESSFPYTLQDAPEAWNMTESAIGENIVWERYGDDGFATSVSTIVEEGPFIDVGEYKPLPLPPFYFPIYWNQVFTEVLSYGPSTLTSSGTSTHFWELKEIEDPFSGSGMITDWVPNFSATASITGGTGDFAGAYGEIKSLPCNIVDFIFNDVPCMVEGLVCIPK